MPKFAHPMENSLWKLITNKDSAAVVVTVIAIDQLVKQKGIDETQSTSNVPNMLAKDKNGHSFLFHAIDKNIDPKIAEYLADYHSRHDHFEIFKTITDDNYYTLIHAAVLAGDKYIPLLVYLFKNTNIGKMIDCVDKKGRTALFCALESNNIQFALLLLHHGAQININDNMNRSCIAVAISAGYIETVVTLSKDFPKVLAEINAKDSNLNTVLHEAVSKLDDKLVDCLLSIGANAAVRDLNGDTPIDLLGNLLRILILKNVSTVGNDKETLDEKRVKARKIVFSFNRHGAFIGENFSESFYQLLKDKNQILGTDVGQLILFGTRVNKKLIADNYMYASFKTNTSPVYLINQCKIQGGIGSLKKTEFHHEFPLNIQAIENQFKKIIADEKKPYVIRLMLENCYLDYLKLHSLTRSLHYLLNKPSLFNQVKKINAFPYMPSGIIEQVPLLVKMIDEINSTSGESNNLSIPGAYADDHMSTISYLDQRTMIANMKGELSRLEDKLNELYTRSIDGICFFGFGTVVACVAINLLPLIFGIISLAEYADDVEERNKQTPHYQYNKEWIDSEIAADRDMMRICFIVVGAICLVGLSPLFCAFILCLNNERKSHSAYMNHKNEIAISIDGLIAIGEFLSPTSRYYQPLHMLIQTLQTKTDVTEIRNMIKSETQELLTEIMDEYNKSLSLTALEELKPSNENLIKYPGKMQSEKIVIAIREAPDLLEMEEENDLFEMDHVRQAEEEQPLLPKRRFV